MKTEQESRTVASIYIGRWAPKVLFSLKEKPHRHGRLRRRIGSVSQRMLTRTLRNLESTGLIKRSVTGTRVIGVEYSLTRLGETIVTPLRGMCRWARQHRKKVTAEVHLQKAQ